MINYKKLFFLLILLIFITFVILFYNLQLINLGILFNSDAFYLPTLFRDIFDNQGTLSDWYLTPAPYFFPDYILYALAFIINKEPYHQIIFFTVSQIIVTFLIINILIKSIYNFDKSNKDNSFFVAVTSTIFFIYFSLKGYSPYIHLLNSAYHYGTFINCILAYILIVKIESKANKSNNFYYILLSLLSFISTLSDTLFIPQFIFPYILLKAFIALTNKDYSVSKNIHVVIVVFFSILAFFSYKLLISHPTRYGLKLNFSQTYLKISNILNLVTSSYLLIAILFVYFAILAYVIFRFFKDKRQSSLSNLTFFSFFCIITSISSHIFTWMDYAPRYLISAFSWPIIIVLSFTFSKKPKISLFISACLVSVLLLSLSSFFSVKHNQDNQFYTKEIACIDNVLKKENLTDGIATYWDAKYLTIISKLNLNIAQYTQDLSEYHWITSLNFYKKQYDFIIISEDQSDAYKIQRETIYKINSGPKYIEKCGNKSVYIFGKKNFKFDN